MNNQQLLKQELHCMIYSGLRTCSQKFEKIEAMAEASGRNPHYVVADLIAEAILSEILPKTKVPVPSRN